MQGYVSLAKMGLLIVVFLAGQPAARGQAQELKRVRALLVIDTNSNLKKSVEIDKANMTMVFRGGIPKGRCDLTVLDGDTATPENVLNYYKNLQTGPTESLAFYYAGHGGTHPEHGHFLALKAGGLYRSDLLQAMKNKNPGLIVILTDCCSTQIQVKGLAQYPVWYEARALLPAHRCLFFQHRGVVDITAATMSESWGNNTIGGYFTKTLSDRIFKGLDKLDTDGDGFLTWKEFFPSLKQGTQETFVAVSRKKGMLEETIRNKLQTPSAAALPDVGDLSHLSKRTFTGPDAKAIRSFWVQKGFCWVRWTTLQEPTRFLVQYRKVKTLGTIDIDNLGNVTIEVTVSPEHYWAPVKR